MPLSLVPSLVPSLILTIQFSLSIHLQVIGALVQALRNNQHVRSISLANNKRITSAGVAELEAVLPSAFDPTMLLWPHCISVLLTAQVTFSLRRHSTHGDPDSH